MPSFDFATLVASLGGLMWKVLGLLPAAFRWVFGQVLERPLAASGVVAFAAGFAAETHDRVRQGSGGFNIISLVVSTLVRQFSRAIKNIFSFSII